MKKEIHPEYGPVAFRDFSTGDIFLTKSTLVSKPGLKTVEIEGQTVPVIEVEVSSYSHPFYTGTQRILDTGGRVAKFQERAAKATKRNPKQFYYREYIHIERCDVLSFLIRAEKLLMKGGCDGTVYKS